jgi:hypothetical protein
MLSWNESTSGLGKQSPRGKQTETTDQTDQTDSGIDRVSNHEFMASLFGESFDSAKPLVCSKPGDPAAGGWMPSEWPCPTSDSGLNWYFGPGLYEPDANGHPRAKREHVQAVHVICLDDVCHFSPYRVQSVFGI